MVVRFTEDRKTIGTRHVIGRGFDSRRLHHKDLVVLPQQGLWGRHGFDGE
jgi:hypothetical protein